MSTEFKSSEPSKGLAMGVCLPVPPPPSYAGAETEGSLEHAGHQPSLSFKETCCKEIRWRVRELTFSSGTHPPLIHHVNTQECIQTHIPKPAQRKISMQRKNHLHTASEMRCMYTLHREHLKSSTLLLSVLQKSTQNCTMTAH